MVAVSTICFFCLQHFCTVLAQTKLCCNHDIIKDNVAISVDQFYTIREAVRATIQMDQDKAGGDGGDSK